MIDARFIGEEGNLGEKLGNRMFVRITFKFLQIAIVGITGSRKAILKANCLKKKVIRENL